MERGDTVAASDDASEAFSIIVIEEPVVFILSDHASKEVKPLDDDGERVTGDEMEGDFGESNG